MPRIFLSYRRADSQAIADRIYSYLVVQFGADSVFKDVDDIQLAQDFRAAIERALITSEVAIVIIGPRWATIPDSSGNPRLNNPADFVRLEVEMALRHVKIVIPVLVDGASMPASADLPSSLHPLVFKQAALVRHDPDFKRDMARMARAIRRAFGMAEPTPIPPPAPRPKPDRVLYIIALIGLAGVILAALISILLLSLNRADEAAAKTQTAQTAVALLSATLSHTPTPTLDPNQAATINAHLSATYLAAATQTPIPPTLALTSTVVPTTQTPISPTETPTATPTETPTLVFFLRNKDWTPVFKVFNGTRMALVPAGCFMMGSAVGDKDNRPPNKVCFDTPFWIDVTPVTNREYGSFGAYNGANYPRESVTWFDADKYCQERGARLPTEAEWEYAARGPDALAYPWGNNFDVTRLNFCDFRCTGPFRDPTSGDGYTNTSPVGTYPGGVSWVGTLDMSGNVWQWTGSIYDLYPYVATDGR